MAKAVENWVAMKIGQEIKLNSKTIGTKLYDGYVYFNLLKLCIPEAQYIGELQINPNACEALTNLQKMCPWFKIIGVTHDYNFLKKISLQDNSSCLKLLFELFLKLEDRQIIYYITKQRLTQSLVSEEGRFQVVKVLDMPIDLISDNEIEEMEKPLITSAECVEKYKEWKSRTNRKKEKIIESKPMIFHKNNNLIPVVTNENENSVKIGNGKSIDYVNPLELVKALKKKRKKHTSLEKVRLQMQSKVFHDMWQFVIKHQENELDETVKKKLLQKSKYETNLELQLFKLQQTSRTFIEQKLMKDDLDIKKTPFFCDSLVGAKDVEKRRIVQLHLKLNNEYCRLKKKYIEDLCFDVIIDLAKLAVTVSETGKSHGEISSIKMWEWKQLFLKGETPGYTIEFSCSNEEKLKKDKSNDILDLEELRRIKILSESYLKSYLHLREPWLIEGTREEENLDVIGFVVHRLLDLKYPKLDPPQPAMLNEFNVRAILSNSYDSSVYELLNDILEQHSVALVTVQKAANHCLKVYQAEKSLSKFAETLHDKTMAEHTEQVKVYNVVSQKANKKVQVPPTIRENRDHSQAGLLGKIVFELLSNGKPLNEILLAKIIIEYLQNLDVKNGFVLVGYPLNGYQARLLDFLISGKQSKVFLTEPRDIDLFKTDSPTICTPINANILLDFNNLITNYVDEKIEPLKKDSQEKEINFNTIEKWLIDIEKFKSPDSSVVGNPGFTYHPMTISSKEFELLRTSKIVPKPVSIDDTIDNTKSYFNKYIDIVQQYITSQVTSFDIYEKKTNELHLDTTDLKNFYGKAGILKQVGLTNFDDTNVKKLAHFILDGLYSESSSKKNSTHYENNPWMDFKREPGDLEETIQMIPSSQLLSQLKSKENIKINDPQVNTNEMPKTNEYCNNKINNQFATTLGTIWEYIEKKYLDKLNFICQQLVQHQSKMLPYANLIMTVKNEGFSVIDDRMNAVNNFQLMLNDVDELLIKSSEVKAELHYRVRELGMYLTQIADDKKYKNQSNRNHLLCQDYITTEMFSTANAYLSLMQIEIDRFVESVQMLNDYYIAMLRGIPEDKRISTIPLKIISPRSEETFLRKASSSMKRKRSSRTSLHKTADTLDHSMSDNFGTDDNVSRSLLIAGAQAVGNKVKMVSAHVKNLIKNESLGEILIELEARKYADKVNQLQDIPFLPEASSPDLQRPSKKSKLSKKGQKSSSPILRENSKASNDQKGKNQGLEEVRKIKLEWEKAVNNEIDRINKRIKLIQTKGENEINNALEAVTRMYKEFDTDIILQYNQEIIAIKKVCEVFSAAIEDECPIQYLMILDNEKFYIDKSNLLFPNDPPKPPLPVEETQLTYAFKIMQLDKIVSKLGCIAPDGIIEDIFMEQIITQDMPEGWLKLSKSDVRNILYEAFGDIGFIDWRDFVIFNVNIPFPTMDDLVEMKFIFQELDQYGMETLTLDQYNNITFWFDKDFGKSIEDDLHLALAKQLLFKTFQINQNEFNYINLLMAFCKSTTSVDGFMKALYLMYDSNVKSRSRCALNEPQKVEGIMVVSKITQELLNSVLDLADRIELNKFYTHSYDTIFSSPLNEYIKSELLLIDGSNVEEDRESIFSEVDALVIEDPHISSKPGQPKEIDFIIKYQDPKWHLCIPYDLALSLLIYGLKFHAISPDHIHRMLDLENRLTDLFKSRGIRGFIKLYEVVESKLFMDLTETFPIFKACNMSEAVEKLLLNKAE